MQKLETGDLIERTFAEEIRMYLPCYEKLWGRFIGNNGGNKACQIHGERNEQLAFRVNLSELTYSLLHNALAIRRIQNEMDVDLLNQDTSSTGYFERRKVFNLINVECGKIYNHIENLMKIPNAPSSLQNLKTLLSSLSEMYSIRHISLHGKELPYFVTDGQVHLPYFDANSGWNHKFTWSAADKGKMFTDWVNDTSYAVLPKINDVFGKLIQIMEEIYGKGFQIQLKGYSGFNASVSGTISNDRVSDTNFIGTSGTSSSSGSSGTPRPN